MLKKLLSLFIFMVLLGSIGSAQVIVKAQTRVEFIEAITVVLDRPAEPLSTLAFDNSPFSAFSNEETTVLGKTSVEKVETIVSRLSDADALEAISTQFKPVGSLVMGKKGLLQFSNGSTMRVNDQFSAKIRDQIYTVRISEVNQDNYVLTLGEVSKRQTFLNNSLNKSSTINRTQPSP